MMGKTWGSRPLILLSVLLGACEIRLGGEKDDAASGRDSASWPNADEDVSQPSPPAWTGACSDCQSSREPAENSLPEESPAVAVDPFKSLLLVDQSLLSDERARNDSVDGPWSFRAQLTWLAGSADATPSFALAWLEQWSTLTSVGPALAPVTPRPAVQRLLLDPWQTRAAPYAPAGPVDLDLTPFRLLAIVNRSDLRSDACTGSAGELRYVYTAIDAASQRPLPMTVSIEVPYPPSRTPQGWARAFADLSALGFGDELNLALEAITREVMREQTPTRARVRSNELALGAERGLPWELREFHVASSSAKTALVQIPLESTPRADLPISSVEAQIQIQESAALSSMLTFPLELRAGAAPVPDAHFKWQSARLAPRLLSAFSRNTCNGCHGGETEALPFQHIAAASSPALTPVLSRYLFDPTNRTGELVRREARLREVLATRCETSPSYR